MAEVETYLNRILKHSFLTRREQAEWKEEMRSHIECSIEDLTSSGYGYVEAERITLRNFGEPNMLRSNLTRQTYGLCVKKIFLLSLGFLLIFLCSFIPSILVDHTSPLSPSLPLTGLIGALFLLKTRKRLDRYGIGIALLPFGLIYTLYKLHIPWAEDLHMTIVWLIYSNSSETAFLVFMMMIFLLGLGIFLLTRCISISSLPMLLMTAYAILPMIKRFNHYLYFYLADVEQWRRYNLMMALGYLDTISIRLFVLACFVIVAQYLLHLKFSHRTKAQG
jgi:hypothetical protein